MTPPALAVMVTGPPVETPVSRPVLETLATVPIADAQLALEVTFWVVPSENVAVAVSCIVPPTGMVVAFIGAVTVIERITAGVTTRVAVPVTVPTAARPVTVPAVTPVATPVMPIVATAGIVVDQETPVVSAREVPSENVPVA